jgi:hypothetical protein
MGVARSTYGREERCIESYGVEPEGKIDQLEDPGVVGKMVLKWIIRKWDVGTWTGSSWFRIGTGCGHL